MSKKKSKSRVLVLLDKGKLEQYDGHIISRDNQSIYGSLQSSLMSLSTKVGTTHNRIDILIAEDYYVQRIIKLLKSIYLKIDRNIYVLKDRSLINSYLNDDRFYKTKEHIEALEELLKNM